MIFLYGMGDCRRWGSDDGMDEWSAGSDCGQAQLTAAAGHRYRRRMSDTGRISDWSKSTQSSDKHERLLLIRLLEFENTLGVN